MSAQVQDTTGLALRPALPRVNLLPPELGERRRFRRVQFASAGAACVALGLVAGGYVLAVGSVSDARTNLQATQSRQQVAQQRVDAYNYVVQTGDLLDSRHQLLGKALTGEVKWSQYLNEFSLHTPSGVWLTHLSVGAPVTGTAMPSTSESLSSSSSATTSGVPTTGTDTTGSTGATGTTGAAVATISFEGEALRYDDVSLWLESLTKDPAYTDPFVTEASEDAVGTHKAVRFIGTVTVTDAALVPNPAGN